MKFTYISRQTTRSAVLGLLTVAFSLPAFSQPYGFSKRFLADSSGKTFTEIVRTDLLSGQKSHFISIPGTVYSLLWDASQQWLFHVERGSLNATKVSDTSFTRLLVTGEMDAWPPVYVPSQGHYVMRWQVMRGGEEVEEAKVLDGATLQIVDSLEGEIAQSVSPFLSADGSTLYAGTYDTLTRADALMAYSLGTKSTLWHRKLFDIGSPTENKSLRDGRHAMALIGYEYPMPGYEDAHLVRYNPQSNTLSPPAACPFRSMAVLSPDARFIIAQRVELDSTAQGWQENRTGEVWTFDAATGKVLQKLNFPPGGTVYVFDADTSHFYYHVEATDTWIKGSVNRDPAVKGGLYLTPDGAGGNTLMMKAKSLVSFVSTDSVMSLTATIRWPQSFRGIMLGTVTSSYGMTKVDTPVTQGSCIYQKFSSTLRSAVPWVAGSEYEILSIPVQGMCGAESFELTNALAGESGL